MVQLVLLGSAVSVVQQPTPGAGCGAECWWRRQPQPGQLCRSQDDRFSKGSEEMPFLTASAEFDIKGGRFRDDLVLPWFYPFPMD